MSEQTELLDVETVRAELTALCERMPEAVNPMAATACLYTDPDDADRHCLIGQWASEHGWPIPGPDRFEGARSAAERLLWPVTAEARLLLRSWQGAADGADRDPDKATPRPWGEVPAFVAATAGGES